MIERLTKAPVQFLDLPSTKKVKEIMIEKSTEEIKKHSLNKVEGRDFEKFSNHLEELSKEELIAVLYNLDLKKKLEKVSSQKLSAPTPSSEPKRVRAAGVLSKGSTRMFVNIGKKQFSDFHEFLGALSTCTDMKKGELQNIEMKDKFSFVNVPTLKGKSLVKSQYKMKGYDVRFEFSEKPHVASNCKKNHEKKQRAYH